MSNICHSISIIYKIISGERDEFNQKNLTIGMQVRSTQGRPLFQNSYSKKFCLKLNFIFLSSKNYIILTNIFKMDLVVDLSLSPLMPFIFFIVMSGQVKLSKNQKYPAGQVPPQIEDPEGLETPVGAKRHLTICAITLVKKSTRHFLRDLMV